MNKQILNNYKYFKLDKNNDLYCNDDSTIEEFVTIDESDRKKARLSNKIISDRIDALKKKKSIISNRDKVRNDRIKRDKKRKEERKKNYIDSKKKFDESNKNEIKLLHSIDFRHKTNDNIYDQLNPDLLVDFNSVNFIKNEGAVFNGSNSYAITRNEISSDFDEMTIEYYCAIYKPREAAKGGIVFFMTSKDDLSKPLLLGHFYKSYTETPQGYRGLTADGQGFLHRGSV